MTGQPDPRTELEQTLSRALVLVDRYAPGTTVPLEVSANARTAALSLFSALAGVEVAVPLVMVCFTAELLGAVAVDLAAHPSDTGQLISRLESELGVRRLALGREVVRAGRLLELPAEVAIEVELALILAFADADTVSLWTAAEGQEPQLVSHAGQPPGSKRSAARVLFGGADHGSVPPDEPPPGVRVLTAPPVAAAVLVGGSSPGQAMRPLLAAAAPMMAILLERRAPPRGDLAAASTIERRLNRLRFDLHDGPQQDIHLLAHDLRLFREQLRPMIAGDPNRDRALGRLDDLEAQLVALDGDLRRLSTSVQSPFLAPGSLAEPLRELTDTFTARTGVVPRVEASGTMDGMTDSQQIALLSLIREALANIREHADARTVEIAISAGTEGVRVEISDDGRGFEPEATLVRSARAGHLGLVGMHERVRMLGGTTRIDSRPGGPTRISATLPPWRA